MIRFLLCLLAWWSVLFVGLVLCGCVATKGDVERIAAKIDQVEQGTASLEDVKAEVADVVEEIEERSSGTLEELGKAGGVSGLVAGAIAVLLNMHRNRTRARDLEAASARARSTA